MLSAIVLASIDSPLGSLSASFVTDIYRPLLVRGRSEAHYLGVSRVCVLVFGVLLGVIAYAFSSYDGILWLAFKIAGVTFGSLLGVFLLGLLTRRRVGDVANVAAMIIMALVSLTLLGLSEYKILTFAWSWLVIVGTAGTMALAMLFTGRASTPATEDVGDPEMASQTPGRPE
jgi:Na+/proline symporter